MSLFTVRLLNVLKGKLKTHISFSLQLLPPLAPPCPLSLFLSFSDDETEAKIIRSRAEVSNSNCLGGRPRCYKKA